MLDFMISVIVPVYNVEKYLVQCVESIIYQTYSNLEIILVDDGSTDSSGRICDELKQRDERIYVIHKENGGLSDARNAGFSICKGEFVSFIDSDDIINISFYEELVKAILEKEVKIAVCRVERFTRNINDSSISDGIKVLAKEEAFEEIGLSYFDNQHRLFCNVAAWQFLMHRSLIPREGFEIGRINEDWFFTYKVIDKIDKIVSVPTAIYYYRIRKGSITNKNISFDILDGMLGYITYLQRKNYQNSLLYARLAFLKKNRILYNTLLLSDNLNNEKKQLLLSNISGLVKKKEVYDYLSWVERVKIVSLLYVPLCYNRVVILRKQLGKLIRRILKNDDKIN